VTRDSCHKDKVFARSPSTANSSQFICSSALNSSLSVVTKLGWHRCTDRRNPSTKLDEASPEQRLQHPSWSSLPGTLRVKPMELSLGQHRYNGLHRRLPV
jgi:hypothetical protein